LSGAGEAHPVTPSRDESERADASDRAATADRLDVDAVLWDIGGVILDVESVQAAHREFVAALVDDHGSPYDLEGALERWRDVVGEYFRERDGTEFRPAREGYRRAVVDIVGDPVDEAAWRDLFRETVGDNARANPDAVAAIERLAATSLHQGICSDVDHEEGERLLDLLGVHQHVDAYTSSESVGRTKPDPAMFETALAKAGVAPDRAVMIGDRYDHDMAGAARAGIATVAYGAADGPAVDYRLDDLRRLPDLLGVRD
jgi:putative hydrolase of the HAD superfamily